MPTKKWHIFHTRYRTPFYVALYAEGCAYTKRKEKIGVDYGGNLYHLNGRVAMSMEEWKRKENAMQRALEKDPKILLGIMRLNYVDYHRFLPLWRRIGALPVSRLSNAVLAKWLRQYVASVEYFWTLCLTPLYAETYLTNLIRAYLSVRLSEEEADATFQTLMTPKKEGIVGQEYRSLLSVALLPSSKRDLALIRHWKKFSWMANQLYTHTFFPLSYYEERLREYAGQHPKARLAAYKKERLDHTRAFRAILKRLKPDGRMRAYIETLNEAIFYRSWRGERPYQSGYFIVPFLEGIAKRLKVPVSDLMYCLPREIDEWLLKGKNVSPSSIAARKKGFVYLPTARGKILTGDNMDTWLADDQASDLPIELKGMVSFPGYAQGPVRVVRFTDDLPRVRSGDILVSASTTPLYAPILGKVKAIVTDEGGVLSHASVISREMEIPCVIGTKNATRVLKDGDIVEVDAEKGTVRIIK